MRPLERKHQANGADLEVKGRPTPAAKVSISPGCNDPLSLATLMQELKPPPQKDLFAFDSSFKGGEL